MKPETKTEEKPFSFSPDAKLSNITRNPPPAIGSDVTVIIEKLFEFKGFGGVKAICEGIVSEVHEGNGVKGQRLRILMVQLDNPKRKQGDMDYALQEVANFCSSVVGAKLSATQLNECIKNIRGAAVRVVTTAKEPDAKGSIYPKYTYVTVPKQDIGAQRLLLTEG